uniref:Uncharacterized protein n=1 Tax=Picea sitchensis TaxID=3332 RepID=A0A6B9XW23_PICSI|nr:hypothetical protein Q903MT_gene5536 [Picea sitchensis]
MGWDETNLPLTLFTAFTLGHGGLPNPCMTFSFQGRMDPPYPYL